MTAAKDARYQEEEEAPKGGLWALLTCRACQAREDYGAFSGVDDSVHVMLHDKNKKKKKGGTSKEKLGELQDPLQVSTHGSSKKISMPAIPGAEKNGTS
mmetsp:Transcript_4961/g.7312  ORF Transcript_4961/g.7312 Transcript_4961/m.7312 type:complete len:99 (+) Transcript_4961:150-446(+)|eukprot:CAMPEP_0172417720 /NCGR_PEP_ID=MMETSP1064-20121228/4234_1 /TAXON_ID=202472 /ORGANISM="Aulacoseira subarctica , Strain CCAP 1002/5" /LENGTH=98 /DNA_ID=CAMNT_0013156215 /DNA_START=140 /DNA_END=436 /DNA_ORIENTATION=-